MKMLKYYAGIVVLAATLAGVQGKAQKSPEKIKSEKIENFKYLFSEALKQKIFGNYGNAVKYFLECEKIKPDDAVEYELSGLFAMAGDESRAMMYGRKALDKDPGNIWYYYQLANIFRMYDMQDSLLAVYGKITGRFPDLLKDQLVYADLLVQTGHPSRAMEVYREVEKKTGKNTGLMQKEAVALLAGGKTQKAREMISQAIHLFGPDKELLLTQAKILMQDGKKEQADRIYRDLMTKYPNDLDVEKQVYQYFVAGKQYNDALNILQKIVEDGMVDPQEKINYVFDISGKIDKTDTLAQEKTEKILNDLHLQYSNDIRTSLLLIDHYSRNGQYDKAKDILRTILEKYPKYRIGWRQMLYVCDQQGDQDSVIYYAEKARELFPKDPLYDVYLGYAWLQKGENDKALEYAQEGIRKVTRRGIDYVDKETGFDYRNFQTQFYGLLGEIYKNKGDYKKSDEAFEKGLKLNPGDDMLLNNYSYYLSLRKEKLRKALKMSGKTVKKNPDNATYLDTYGWILFQMGRLGEAKEYIQKALENGGGTSPEILLHYGDIMKASGNKDAAVKYWKKALENGGDKKKIEKRLNAE